MTSQSNHARRLRRHGTLAEAILWRRLRNRALAGAKFRRQHPIGPYVADLCRVEAALVVEVDGSHHAPHRDARRSAFLEAEGFIVLRFGNDDVVTHPNEVLRRIEEALTRNR